MPNEKIENQESQKPVESLQEWFVKNLPRIESIAGAGREFSTMSVGSFFMWASFIESLLSSENSSTKILGYSPVSFGIAVPLALSLAYGAGVTQLAVDKFNEDRDKYLQKIETIQGSIRGKKSDWKSCLANLTCSDDLPTSQKLLIGIGLVAQSGDLMGLILTVLSTEMGKTSNQSEQVSANIGIIVVGLVAAWALMRVTYFAMMLMNGKPMKKYKLDDENPNKHLDIWSYLFLVPKTLQVLNSSLLYCGVFLDKVVFNRLPDTLLGISEKSLLLALPPAIGFTVATMYLQYFLIIASQSLHVLNRIKDDKNDVELQIVAKDNDTLSEESSKTEATMLRKTVMNSIYVINQFAISLDFSVGPLYLLKDQMSAPGYTGLMAGLTLLGYLAGGSGVNSMKESRNYYLAKNENKLEHKLDEFHKSLGDCFHNAKALVSLSGGRLSRKNSTAESSRSSLVANDHFADQPPVETRRSLPQLTN